MDLGSYFKENFDSLSFGMGTVAVPAITFCSNYAHQADILPTSAALLLSTLGGVLTIHVIRLVRGRGGKKKEGASIISGAVGGALGLAAVCTLPVLQSTGIVEAVADVLHL